MAELKRGRRVASAAAAIALAGMVGACAEGPPVPAPVVFKGGDSDFGAAPPGGMAGPVAPPVPHRSHEGRHIVVRRGQSLGRLAEQYHVPKREIIAANRLTPPYTIEIGQRLLIPGGGERAPEHTAAAAPMPLLSEHRSRDVIPLDAPPPPRTAAAAVTAATPAPQAAALPPHEPDAAAEARADDNDRAAGHGPSLPHGGRLPWPVHGKVLAGYGGGAGARHNDGINIAAPKGAPVRAVEGGIVAYAGNELRGYGNLVLIKHPDGFISAYAHCEELLVRRGDKVAPGQVIAKVGATGGVSEPQLHFELRRGEHAVDPRGFLAPAPSAASGGSESG